MNDSINGTARLMRRLAPALLLVAASCAGNTVRPVSPSTDAKETGFRYYESSPYVLVYSDGKNGLVAKIINLPDRTRMMAARPYAYLASNTTKLNFANGVLTDSSEKADSSTIPRAAIEAIKQAAVAAAGSFLNQPAAPRQDVGFGVPTPFLYKIVADASGISIRGGQPTMPDGTREIRVVDLTGK